MLAIFQMNFEVFNACARARVVKLSWAVDAADARDIVTLVVGR